LLDRRHAACNLLIRLRYVEGRGPARWLDPSGDGRSLPGNVSALLL
jgi:hypothetical protein